MHKNVQMDSIISESGNTIIIDELQKNVRKNLIRKYVYCRKMQKMTQAELAKKVGVPRSNITRFEGGTYNPSLEMLVKIANALNMNLSIQLVKSDMGYSDDTASFS